MAEIICFANSIKHYGRCVAGIDVATKQWVRPIGKGDEGAIGNQRLIDGQEPEFLVAIDIPTGGPADDLGCQPENRILLKRLLSKSSIKFRFPIFFFRYHDV